MEGLTSFHRVFLLILVSIGNSIVYTSAYLQYVSDGSLQKALIAAGTTSQDNAVATIDTLLAAYSWTAFVCHLPSGIVVDCVRVRALAWVGFSSTALFAYWYTFFPSYIVLTGLFIGMGITIIPIWWGIRLELVRLISEEEIYSRNIGTSYGPYDLASLILGSVNAAIVSLPADQDDIVPMRIPLLVPDSTVITFVVLSFFFIPKFEGEIDPSDEGFGFKQLGQVLSNPVARLATPTLFFVYFFYTGINWATGYMKDTITVTSGTVLIVGAIRTYGVSLISGPVFGAIVAKLGSPSRVIGFDSMVVMIGLAVFAFLPAQVSLTYMAVAMAIPLAFIINGIFGIYSSQLTEDKVPARVFGTVTGLLSVVGFIPDALSYIQLGSIYNAHQDDPTVAHNQIFLILAGAALTTAVRASILIVATRKRNVEEDANTREDA